MGATAFKRLPSHLSPVSLLKSAASIAWFFVVGGLNKSSKLKEINQDNLMYLLLQIKKLPVLLSLLISTVIQAGVPEGVEAFNKNQYAKARVELEKPAEAGDAQAMSYMADMFLRGLGGSRDELKARNYINAAHEKGNPKATYLLGNSYLNGTLYTKDELKGAELIKQSATNHHAEAQALLGAWIALGVQGYAKDEVLALTWIKAAAEKNNAMGMNWLGTFYEFGRGGLSIDLLQAIDYYKKSASLGSNDAKISAGRMYALGRGVSSNGVEALKYLRDAASFSFVNAYPWIASVYEFGRGGTPKNLVLAYAWYAAIPSTATANNVKAGNEGKERLSKVLTSIEQSDGEKIAKTVLDNNRGVVLLDMINTIKATIPEQRKNAFGSGFVVGDLGEILTNEHVIANCQKIRIMPANLDARVMSKDTKNDLALLKIEDMKTVRLPAAKFRSGRGIRMGDEVVVIGYPLPGALSTGAIVTTGIINALSGLNNDTSAFQMSATVQPGSSGGPVFDRMGNLVGVVRARLTPNMPASPQNINFAINLATTTGFLDANNVNYAVAPPSDKQISIADLTANAQKSTVQVECY